MLMWLANNLFFVVDAFQLFLLETDANLARTFHCLPLLRVPMDTLNVSAGGGCYKCCYWVVGVESLNDG